MVDILMATYNGEKFIMEQIESILNQTYKEWILYIRDDGSTDNTLNIIKRYSSMYSDKIIVIEDGKKNLGCKMNFKELMKYSNNKYCMFCDQDDIWLNNKIEISLEEIRLMENEHGQDTPILVHTDLVVVDSNLNKLNDSFWNSMQIDANLTQINRMLVRNNVTGCTMIINEPLKNLSEKISEDCFMHDWWIALIASTIGKIGIIKQQTILYRQHEGNQVGAKAIGAIETISKMKKLQTIIAKFKSPSVISKEIKQAKAFLSVYRDKLSEKDRACISRFCSLPTKNIASKRVEIIKSKFYTHRLIDNIRLMLFV